MKKFITLLAVIALSSSLAFAGGADASADDENLVAQAEGAGGASGGAAGGAGAAGATAGAGTAAVAAGVAAAAATAAAVAQSNSTSSVEHAHSH